jgi:hypothetical protein
METRRGLRVIIHCRLRGEQFKAMLIAQGYQRIHDLLRLDKAMHFIAKLFVGYAKLVLQILYNGFEGFFHSNT